MKYCVIKTVNQCNTLQYLLFSLFGICKIFKHNFNQSEDFSVFYLTVPKKIKEKKKRKLFDGACKFLKENGVKYICEAETDPYFLYHLKMHFSVITGKKTLIENFFAILTHFSIKKGYSLKESELVFVSNYPQEVKQLLLLCIKDVKKVSVFTTAPERFSDLLLEFHKQYGVFIQLKSKKSKLKRYQTFYVNLESEPIVESGYFKTVSMLDMYGVYENAFSRFLFGYQTKNDDILKAHHIVKNLQFTDFYLRCCVQESITPKMIEIKQK